MTIPPSFTKHHGHEPQPQCPIIPQTLCTCLPSAYYPKTPKIGIYKGLPKSTPKLSHPCCARIISKGTRLPRHTNVSTENLDPGTRFYIEFSFLKKVSCENITSALTIVDDTNSHLFGYPTISKCTPIKIP